jgi:hypothetical protein
MLQDPEVLSTSTEKPWGSPGADVATGEVPAQLWPWARLVPVQIWQGMSPVPVQMLQGDENSPGTGVTAGSQVPAKMWQG